MATSEGIPSSIDIEFLELNDNPYFIPNWGSTIEYDDDVYIFDLGMGVVEAYPVFDDGEPYDYSLRLVGKVIKNKNHHV